MLLELEAPTILHLLSDPQSLDLAVSKAKTEYLREKHPAALPSIDDLGEELYHYVAPGFPSNAAKITGMCSGLRSTHFDSSFFFSDNSTVSWYNVYKTDYGK